MLYLWIIGFISILGQTVLLRELSVAYYGIELIYLLALGLWLLWGAAGAAAGRWSDHGRPGRIRWLLLAYALLVAGDVAFIRGIRILFSDVPGAYLSFGRQILSMSVALLPVGWLSGWLFQIAAVAYLRDRRSLALAYGIECAGGLAGGLAATLSLQLGMQNFTLALACSLCAAAATLFPWRGAGSRLPSRLGVVASLALIVCLFASDALDRAMTAWNHPQLLASRDSAYSRVTVTRSGGQVSVFENDALSFETEGTAAEEFVHLAALQHPEPRIVLLAGGGIEGGVKEVLQHNPQAVDYVELNRVLLRLARPALPGDLAASLEDRRVSVTAADPRTFLQHSRTYDLILVGMPEPGSGQANRFYTAEFFAQCARRMSHSGVLAFRLPSSENLWTPQLARRNAGIYWALKSAFSDVIVLPGSSNLYLAAREALPKDPEILVARFETRRLRSRVVSAPYIRYLYRNDRFRQVQQVLQQHTMTVNRDEQPICYQQTVVLWLSKFFPSLTVTDLLALWPAGTLLPWILWAPGLLLVCFFWWARVRSPARRVSLAAVAGFLGMVLETLLLLHYQTKSGVLYQDVGVLLMSFMAGMAFGSYAVGKHASMPVLWMRRLRCWGTASLGGFALLCLWIAGRIRSGALEGLAETASLLAVAGFLAAVLFGFASMQGSGDPKRNVAPLYAADLLGGCLGSLAGTLLLIPMGGMRAAALLMSLLSVAALPLPASRDPAG